MKDSVSNLALCNVSQNPLGRLALCNIVLAEDGKTPPEWVQLIPKGPQVKALDGREFENSDPQAIIDAFNADPRDLPLDWEHATELKASKGEQAPAAGWVVAMENRNGEIWGQIEWNESGAKSVVSKEYKYISPAFSFMKSTKKIFKLVSAALVNRPALDMPALAHDKQTENEMDPKLLALLGLAADATIEQVLAAITTLRTDSVAVASELAAAKTTIAKKDEEIALAQNTAPALDKFVPRSDYDIAVARAETAERENNETKAETLKKEIDVAITSAMQEGKITPATEEYHRAQCAQEGGLERFNEYVKAAPKIVADSDLDGKPRPNGEPTTTDAQLAIAQQCGITVEQYKEAAKN